MHEKQIFPFENLHHLGTSIVLIVAVVVAMVLVVLASLKGKKKWHLDMCGNRLIPTRKSTQGQLFLLDLVHTVGILVIVLVALL